MTGAELGVEARAGLAHRRGAVVDPLGAAAGLEQKQACDLAVGAPGRGEHGVQPLRPDPVDLGQRPVQGFGVCGGGAADQRAVDVEQQ